MPVTAVNLLHERRASSQNTRASAPIAGARRNRTVVLTTHARLRHAVSDRQAKPEPEERARIVAFVVVEV